MKTLQLLAFLLYLFPCNTLLSQLNNAPARITAGQNVTWGSEGFYYITDSLVIERGATLNLQFSTIAFKYHSDPARKSRIIVKGQLRAEDSYFTSERDNLEVDYNNDGRQSIARPGDWGYIYFEGSDAAYQSLVNCTFKYGGGCKYTPLNLDIDNATIYQHWRDGFLNADNIEISKSLGFGIEMDYANLANSLIHECENGIKCNSGWVTVAPTTFIKDIRRFPVFFNNCFPSNDAFSIENVLRNGINGIVVAGILDGTGVVGKRKTPGFTEDALHYNPVGDPYPLTWSTTLPIYIYKPVELKNVHLTISPGTVVKFMAYEDGPEKTYLTADKYSIIDAVGTADNKITFTSEYDKLSFSSNESALPLANDWGYIKGRNLTFEHCDFKYGGVYYNANRSGVDESLSGIIQMDENYEANCSISITNCMFSDIFKHAIVSSLTGTVESEPPHINNCSFILPANCFGVKCTGPRSENPMINAINNFWNSNTGPYHETLNSTGNGCLVGDGIDFIPYLKERTEILGEVNSTLKGKITDENNTELIGAEVQLAGKQLYTALSDSSGNFTLSDVHPGTGYRLTACASGHYGSEPVNLDIYNDTVQFYNIELRQRAANYMVDTMNFNVNPIVSVIGESGTAYRYYKIVDRKSLSPAGKEKVYIDGDEEMVFEANENGIVSIAIPSDKIGNAGTQETFTITRIGENSAPLEDPYKIPFTVKVVPYSYFKTWVGEAYISMGILWFQGKKTRGSALDLLMRKDPEKDEADSIFITRKSQLGGGVNLDLSSLPYSSEGEGKFSAGPEAEIGVNFFKLLEDKYKFDYDTKNGKLALAQFIVLADGMMPMMDAPLVRLFVRCLERQNAEIRNASVSSTIGAHINLYGSMKAGLDMPGNFTEVDLNHGSLKGDANIAFNYTNYINHDRNDFTLSLSAKAEGEVSLSNGFGMLGFIGGFMDTPASHILNPAEGTASGSIHKDYELGIARNIPSPYSWLTIGYGYNYDVDGRFLNMEGSGSANKDLSYTFTFKDDKVKNILQNSTALAKSFLGPLGGKMDLQSSTASMDDLFNTTFRNVSDSQQIEPRKIIKLPYEKTVNQEFAKGAFDAELTVGISNISIKFGAGYEFTGLYKYLGEKGEFYNHKLYAFETYPTLVNNDDYQAKSIVWGIIKNAAGYVWTQINPAQVFKRFVGRLFHLKGTGSNTMDIGPPARKSWITMLGQPMVNDTTIADSIEAFYWDWYGAGFDTPTKSTEAEMTKIRNYVRMRATNLHKLDYGVGGFYQFEPYNIPISGDGATIHIRYLEDELTVMLADSSTYTIPEENLRVYKEDKEHNTWIYIGGVVDTDSNYVTAQIDSLGTFTLAPYVPKGTIELAAYPDTIHLEEGNTARVFSGIVYYDTDVPVARNELFTVDLNKGSIITPDADTGIAGMQVAANGYGYIEFYYRADTISGVATIKVSSRKGNAIGYLDIPIVDNTAPQIPVIQSAFVNENDIVVNWIPPADMDLAGYKLYYGTMSGGPYNGSASVTGDPSPISMGILSGTRVKGLEQGKTYYFILTAVDRCNNESGFSNEYTVATLFNNRPVLYNQKIMIDSNLAKGTIIDTLIAEDADPGQKLTFYLNKENTCDVFSLDSLTGILRVEKNEKLNYSQYGIKSFEVNASVKDNGEIPLSDDAIIIIQLILPAVPTDLRKSHINQFSIQPNPASDKLEIRFNPKEPNEGGKIQVVSGQGQPVLSRNYTGHFPETDVIDLSDFPAGIYYVILQTTGSKETEKLVLIK